MLRTAGDDAEHVLPEKVDFVHWGEGYPTLVVETPGGWDLVSVAGRSALPWRRPYQWDRAQSFGSRIVVPTDTGVSVITPGRRPKEDYHALLDPPVAPSTRPATTPAVAEAPRICFDGRGFLAWVPPDAIRAAGHVARYADEKWTPLTAAGWVPRPVHLIPLLDGSVIQVVAGDDGGVVLQPVSLEAADVDPAAIEALVDQLGDDDPDKRSAAYATLARYGQGIWPVLEKHADDPSPEVSGRVKGLLKAKRKPTLGGMELAGDGLRLLGRFPEGGVLFYTDAGVSMPSTASAQEPTTVSPAWLSVCPGQPVELLPAGMVNGLKPGVDGLTTLRGSWVRTGTDGPQRFQDPDRFLPLLRKGEREFTRLVAIDRRGRWVFRKDAAGDDQTLLLDPTLPDPTPHLAVWLLNVGGPVGWDRGDWPVVTRTGKQWVVDQAGWRPLDPTADRMETETQPQTETQLSAPADRPASPATTSSTTTAPDTRETPAGPLLLTDPDGVRYYDGRSTLTVVTPAGARRTWPLPPAAAAPPDADNDADAVRLVRAGDGLLFLFNAPGRVVRLCLTPADAESFRVDAVFTNGIPAPEHLQRVWLDPAGRIDVAYDHTRLAILFPTGQVPPDLAKWVPPADLHTSGDE